jgi:hypothetical protein
MAAARRPAQRKDQIRIDIDALTEAELIDLNNRIVERLRFLSQMRSHNRMLDFRLGDRVAFQRNGRHMVPWTLARYNERTVTVITDAGERWNVAPALPQPIIEVANAGAGAETPQTVRKPEK